MCDLGRRVETSTRHDFDPYGIIVYSLEINP